MKLLSTIAAVLISISAFSQDLIEYNESTYSLNGEKVSLEYKKSMTGFNPNAESMFEFSLGGTFSRNGEVLTMEQIQSLTKRYNVGGSNLRKANKCLHLVAQKPNDRVLRNTLNGIGGIATCFVSYGGFVIGENFLTDNGNYYLEFYHPPTGRAFIALGTVSASTAIYLFSNIGNKQAFEVRANKQFKKVAEKINQAIQSSNQ